MFLLNQSGLYFFILSISIFTNISKYVSSRELSFINIYMHVNVLMMFGESCGIWRRRFGDVHNYIEYYYSPTHNGHIILTCDSILAMS